ncbi:MAG: hypothetical protein Q9215_006659 [Flavoplaca cf. flavocitrina]
MALSIPAALKSADITRFAQRAGQVEKAKPAIAYWCNYWIVNQLISKGLHNVDDECTRYTTELMDKLERIKTEHGNDDTIVDDVAAQVYVEQFALETFQRAENAMRANKVSRQTADTFLAAGVFLELRQIWEPLDNETSSKTKYAKYHALRIAKAIKVGEDPNMSNPAPDPSPAQEAQDPDVQMLDENSRQAPPFQPTVEDIPDEHDRLERSLAQRSSIDQSLHPSRAPSIPRPAESGQQSAPPVPTPPERTVENYYQQSSIPDVSPLQSPDRARNGSLGGGYFPKTPESYNPPETSQAANGQMRVHKSSSGPDLPDASSLPPPMPFGTPGPPISPSEESAPSLSPPSFNYHQPSPPSAPAVPYSSQLSGVTPFHAPGYPQPPAPSIQPQPTPAPLRQTAAPPPPPHISQQPINAPSVAVDEEAILKAQKHARWAISALNFEDVNTAVKELRVDGDIRQTVQSTNTSSFTTKDKRDPPCHERHHKTENGLERKSIIVILRLPKQKISPVASLQRPSQIYIGQIPNSDRDDSDRTEELAERISELRNKKRRLCADLNLIDVAFKERAAELQYPSPLSLQPTTKTSAGFTQQFPIIEASIEAMATEAARYALSADKGIEDPSSNQGVTLPTANNYLTPWTCPPPVVSIDNYASGHPLFVVTGDRWLDLMPYEDIWENKEDNSVA